MPTELNLPDVLETLLDKQITEQTAHSSVLCKKCYKLADEFDELQHRVAEIKDEMAGNYHNTVEKREHPETTESDAGKIQERSMKTNELPKKILDIPSSDDESTQVIPWPKFKTL